MPLPSLVGGVSSICTVDEDFGQAVTQEFFTELKNIIF